MLYTHTQFRDVQCTCTSVNENELFENSGLYGLSGIIQNCIFLSACQSVRLHSDCYTRHISHSQWVFCGVTCAKKYGLGVALACLSQL